MKKKSSLFFIALLVVILTLNLSNAYAFEEVDNQNEIGLDLARKIAVAFVWESSDNVYKFEDYLSIEKTTPMYDFDKSISAYLIEFLNQDNKPAEYIVVGATSDYHPIIEFSFSDKPSFIYESIASVGASKQEATLYYTGGYNYYFKHKGSNNLYHIYGDDALKISKNSIHQKITTSDKSWLFWRKKAEDVTAVYKNAAGNSSHSTLGDGDFVITNPAQYEQGAISGGFFNVSNFNITYKRQSSFSGTNNCGPNTGVNLMIYWANRDSTKYSGLMQDDSTWKKTYDTLYKDMKTETYNTTYLDDFRSALNTYFSNYANGATVNSHNWTTTWSKIYNEISANYPVGLLTQSHNYYGDHYVLGVGYAIFTYSDGSTSNYIRIADGSSTSADRYINYSIGYSTSSRRVILITVRPK